MNLLDVAIIFIAATALGVMLHPQVRNNRFWRATVTPLASIIGSGFLIVAPLMGRIAGQYALLAMAGIVLFAMAIGAAIRFNIRHAEPLEQATRGPHARLHTSSGQHNPAPDAMLSGFGHVANWALAVAYVISVAFYIRLLAAFALSMTPLASSGPAADMLATLVLAGIGLLGLLRGFHGLEWTEVIAVSIKLPIITALLVALLWHDATHATFADTAHAADLPPMERLRMLAGMLLIVQGFETSRYLGQIYSPAERRRSMLLAQVIAGLVYLAFIALVQPLLAYLPEGRIDETAIITITRHVALVLPWLLVVAALMSQLSAAIADTAGAGGLIVEESRHLLHERRAYPLLIAASIALIWAFDIFQVVAIASRAFAFYYMMEALIAWRAARLVLPRGAPRTMRQASFLLLALALAAVTMLARSAESS